METTTLDRLAERITGWNSSPETTTEPRACLACEYRGHDIYPIETKEDSDVSPAEQAPAWLCKPCLNAVLAMSEDRAVTVNRTLTETYGPSGRHYEYSSEEHNIVVTVKRGNHPQETAGMLRKLAGWIDNTNLPLGDEPPF